MISFDFEKLVNLTEHIFKLAFLSAYNFLTMKSKTKNVGLNKEEREREREE